MGMINRAIDYVTGRSDSGRAVDAAYPNVPMVQRHAMVRGHARQVNYRQAFKRFAYGTAGRTGGIGTFGPNNMTLDLSRIRAEGRRVSQTNPHARQAVRILADWTVGSGFNMTCKAQNKTTQARLDKAVKEWFFTSNCDANRHGNFYELTHLAYQTVKSAGECLVRVRPRKVSDGLAVPMALEVLPPDYFYEGIKPAVSAGNSYAAGIEFSPIGHPVAYWLYRGHPDDALTDRTPVRVPIYDNKGVRQIVHLFDREFPGQIRGIPRASIIVNTIYEQNDLRMSILSRKRAEAKNVYWLKTTSDDDTAPPPEFGAKLPAGSFQDEDGTTIDSLTGEVVDTPDVPQSDIDPDALGAWVQEQLVGEGNIVTLPNDFDIKETQLSTASDYVSFMEDLLNTIATGFGVPSSLMTANLKGVPFSGSKVGFLQFKAEREREQEYWISELCQFVWTNFALAGGRMGMWNPEDVTCDFRANAFPSVEPVKDQAVFKAQLGTLVKSPEQVASEQGQDWEESIRSWHRSLVSAGYTQDEAVELVKQWVREAFGPKTAVTPVAPINPDDPEAEPPEPGATKPNA